MAKSNPHPQNSLDQLESRLAGGEFPPAFLFHGPQDYFRAEGLRIVLAHGGDRDRVQLDGSTPPEEARKLAGDLMTPSLFGAGKILVVREDVPLTGRKALPGLEEGIRTFLGRPTPGVHLVLLRRDRVAASTRLFKAFQAARAVVIFCRDLYATPFPGNPPWNTEFHRWLQGQASRKGLQLASESLLLLGQVLGNPPGEAAGFLERLKTHLGERREDVVGPQVVLDLLGPGGEANQFELASALLQGNLPRALTLARGIARGGLKSQDGRPMDSMGSLLVTLSWIHTALVKAFRAHLLLARGVQGGQVERELKVHYFRDRFWREVRASSPEALARGLRALLRAQARLKRDFEDPERLLEALVTETLVP